MAERVISMPEHRVAHVDVTAEAVIQFIDRGLLVHQLDEEFVVHEVRITYRWERSSKTWQFKAAAGWGYRKMPGTGYLGTVRKRIDAMHPDYRVLAQEAIPTWIPE